MESAPIATSELEQNPETPIILNMPRRPVASQVMRSGLLFYGPLVTADHAIDPSVDEHSEAGFVPPFHAGSSASPSVAHTEVARTLAAAASSKSEACNHVEASFPPTYLIRAQPLLSAENRQQRMLFAA
jgi:hypothetical protein